MRFRPLSLLLVPALTLGLVFAACGGDDDDDDDDIDPSILGTVVPSPTPGEAGTQELAITATDFAFDPSEATVRSGAVVTVKFTNSGEATHTLNFFADEALRNRLGETGQIAAGAGAEFDLIAPASGSTIYFRCQLHPSQMTGTVSVE